MLILTRRTGQSIHIGEDLQFRVAGVGNGLVSYEILRSGKTNDTGAVKPGTFLRLGEEVVVYVRNIRRRECQIGVSAPREVVILRSEMLEQAAMRGHGEEE